MKICTKCLLQKDENKFRFHRNKCRVCELLAVNEYHRTRVGLSVKMYKNQKVNSKKRGHKPPTYTRVEFTDWLLNNEDFHILYLEWVLSDYKKELTPSVDRLDDYKSYSFDNIRLVTWHENNLKGCIDRINGINNKKSNAIIQKDLQGNIVKRFYSVAQAARETGINFRNIHAVAKLQRKTAGGFSWHYDTPRG